MTGVPRPPIEPGAEPTRAGAADAAPRSPDGRTEGRPPRTGGMRGRFLRTAFLQTVAATTALVVALWTGGLAEPPVAAAQEAGSLDDRDVARLLEEASTLETRGELLAAEERLRLVLEDDPTTAAAVVGLERVLRGQRRPEEVLPAIDAYLEERPDGARVRRLQLQVLARLDSLSALEDAAREWIDLRPDDPEPYRQAVLRFGDALGPERALEVLREARERLERPRMMALAAGDLLERAGRSEEAGREWGDAILQNERSVSSVLRRIDRLPGDGGPVVRTALDRIAAEDPSPSTLRSAARLALEAGLSERATGLADRAVEDLGPRARKGFLVEFARRAEQREARSVALWAYDRVRGQAESPEEALALDQRIAELATEAGEVERALEARRRIARSHPPESSARRRALAEGVELEIEERDPEAAARSLATFREEFPEAPELDALAARLARRLAAVGDTARAAEVVRGVRGHRSALERGYLHLEAGEIDAGAAELSEAMQGMGPEEATDLLELLVVLEGAGPRGARLAGRTAALERRGRAGRAVETLDTGLPDVAVDDRPALLALGARIAERGGDAAKAAELRARIVAEHAEAPQYPEAALRLARHRARSSGAPEAAVEILEELIVSRPESAVTPEARRELERLRAEIPGRSR